MYSCTPFGENDYVFIMVGTPKMWEALCKVIDRLDLLDDERSAHAGRAATSTATSLHGIIADWCRDADQASRR